MYKSNPEKDLIYPAWDRFNEAKFWLHGMKIYYHNSDQFRWHLNSYLRAMKEVPEILLKTTQKKTNSHKWIRNQIAKTQSDPLLSKLSEKRNYLVHNNMLVPNSILRIGIKSGDRLKLGIGQDYPAHLNSEQLIQMSVLIAKDSETMSSLLFQTGDEYSVPAVYRIWKLNEFDDELVLLCEKAWITIGKLLITVMEQLEINLDEYSYVEYCNIPDYQFMEYDPQKYMENFKSEENSET